MRAKVSAAFITAIVATIAAVPAAGAEWWEIAKDAAIGEMATNEAKDFVMETVKDTALADAADKLIETEEDEDSVTVTNWSDMYIEVTAMGTANMYKAQNEAHALILAEETARALAYRKLTERAYGVYVNSRNIIKDGVTGDDTVLVACEGYINNAKEINVTHEKLADGSILCTVTLGALITTDDGLMKVGNIMNANEPAVEVYSPVTKVYPGDYSGVIIDARDLDVNPALYPNVVTEDGKLVYGAQFLNPEYALMNGVSTYVRSIEEARNHGVGESPFIVKALKTMGAFAADLVLPGVVVDQLFGLEEQYNHLSEGRVVIMTR
jgi:hypothetical protein